MSYTMKRAILTVNIACSTLAVLAQPSQGHNNGNNGNGHGHGHGNHHSRNNTISISYSFTQYGNPNFSANPVSNNDMVNGIAFNNGNAIRYKVSSGAPYYISIQAATPAYTSTYAGAGGHQKDIRDFIFFRVVENTTGGGSVQSGTDGDRLGSLEKTIINNCPATYSVNNSGNNDDERTFSLLFKLKTGYSIPPGNYITPIYITATQE